MQFSLKWLQVFFNKPFSSSQLDEKLTRAGLEVDSITKVQPRFEKVIVALVRKTKPHPDADRLCIATVFDGKEELQVVCGAKNCRANLITAFAPVGASLIDASGKSHLLKKSTLRGVESHGMLLSLEELGLEEQSEGIVELDPEYEIGQELAPFVEDEILEISFTPNLGHAMSHLGIAREIACHLNLPYHLQEISKPSLSSFKTEDKVQVKVMDSQLCPVYGCRWIENVKIGPSPLWLRLRLQACGLKSINNVVDVTNYILHELGQPMHAFDADQIQGDLICVQKADRKLLLSTLDGQERNISPETLLICDQNRALAIAGVMGGANSQVGAETQNILLEAALFNPSSIRKTSKTLTLFTEASKHFERGTDPQMIGKALDRAAALIAHLAGGNVSQSNLIISSLGKVDKKVNCRLSQVNRLLGTSLTLPEVKTYLEKLEFIVNIIDENHCIVSVPSYRNDVHLEVDLIEEVARAHGLHQLQSQETTYRFSELPDGLVYQMEQKLHSSLLQQGLQEVISCDLISPEMNALQADESASIATLNYMSKEQSVLRASMLANHLQILKHNQDHQNRPMHIYEIGKVYTRKGECFDEVEKVAIALMGRQSPYHWSSKENNCDFFHLKGILENILDSLHIAPYYFQKSDCKNLHPGTQADLLIEEEIIGTLGELHPSILRKMGIKEPVFFAEFALSPLVPKSLKPLDFHEISSFPASERDWTFTSYEVLEIGHLMEAIRVISSRLLKDVFLLDLYRSEKIGSDKKNVTLRFVYRNDKKTISFEAVEIEHARIMSEVQKKMKNLIIQPS